jgi:hypothetical protein
MLITRRCKLWRALRRRLTASLALVAYLAASVGFPLPLLPAKSDGTPFPCQGHVCGCQSAEECWRHCCCYTAAERWAWARQHHVQPPAYAEPPTPTPSLGWNTPRQRDLARAASPAPTACPCCAVKQRQTAGATDRSAAHQNARPTPEPAPRCGSLAPLRCRGVSTMWASTGAVLVPLRPFSWSVFLVPVGRLTSADFRAPRLAALPPDPPPRSPSL